MEYAAQDSTSLAPLGMLFLAVMTVLTFVLPRRLAFLPLLATVCYMPLGQQMIIGGLHFPILRLLILTGVVRVISRGEWHGLAWNRMDKVFLWWAVLSVVLGTLSRLTPGVFVNRLGAFYYAVGIYFLVSCWVKDTETFLGLVKVLAVMMVPIAVSMVIEKFTARNVFSILGGVPAITVERGGHLRCQAVFRHPILAGTFGATAFPLFVGLWFQGGKAKKAAMLGGISACIVTIAASSSGALVTLLLGGVGFALWRLRHRMRLVRRGILVAILLLALVMNAPVWYLTARLSGITGGTGWYRGWLIDQAVAHFDEWWLCGTTYTANWSASGGEVLDDDPDNIDITNQFVLEGVRGGVLKLTLFFALIVFCFKAIGRRMQNATAASLAGGMLLWATGVSVYTHCISFFSVTYYDQLAVIWYWLLAVISRIAYDESTDAAPAASRENPESRAREDESTTPAQELAVG
jgi:hypothetical protein